MSKSSDESIAEVKDQHGFFKSTQQQQHEYTWGFPVSSYKIDKNVFVLNSSSASGLVTVV